MKCKICDCILTDEEAVMKDMHGNFLDLCEACAVPWDDEWEDEMNHIDPDSLSKEDTL